MAKVQQKSYGNDFWAFINEKPRLTAAIAFGIGTVAGKLTSGASLKRIKKLSPEFTNAGSQLAQAALEYLPGRSPRLQPSAGKVSAKAKTSRRTKGTKSS